MLNFSGLSPMQLLVFEMVMVFVALGVFFSWVAFSIARLRKSNHDIRNQLQAIALVIERDRGSSPLASERQ